MKPEIASDRLTFSVKETAALLGISSDLVYDAVREKRIPAVRLGRRIVIPREGVARFLEQATAPQAA